MSCGRTFLPEARELGAAACTAVSCIRGGFLKGLREVPAWSSILALLILRKTFSVWANGRSCAVIKVYAVSVDGDSVAVLKVILGLSRGPLCLSLSPACHSQQLGPSSSEPSPSAPGSPGLGAVAPSLLFLRKWNSRACVAMQALLWAQIS